MNRRRRIAPVLALSAVAAVPGFVPVINPAGHAEATVCVNAGRRVSVSGCTNIGNNIARYAPPPSVYAPLPEDSAPPPPPP